MKSILTTLLCFAMLTSSIFAAEVISGSTIAFVRGGDIWLMESDGSNQRPFVAGIGNVRGRMSWSPDNKQLVFARSGEVAISYPEGGRGQHRIYDLFFALPDSSNNWWEGITETLGAFAPEFSRDGKKIVFVHDLNGNVVNAILPKYRPAFYDVKTRLLRNIDFEEASDLTALLPSMSPDGSKIAFVVMRLRGQQFTPVGIAVCALTDFPMSDEKLLKIAGELPNAGSPSWSPDGNWIAYISSDLSKPGLYVVKPDLSEKKMIYEPPAGLTLTASPPSWSPDGKMLLLNTVNGSIYKATIGSSDEPVRLSGPGNDSAPAWCN